MSHSIVIVALPAGGSVEDRLAEALAPFDENLSVEPYHDYEDGSPAEFWLYQSLKRAAQDAADGTGIKPYEPDALGQSNMSSKEAPEVQRAKIEADAALFRALPDPVTWDAIAKLHNERYFDSGNLMHVDEDGRAYTMSTYNKRSKWDWYLIGGRWTGYFSVRPEWVGDPALINGEPGVMTEPNADRHKCDGGPKRMLDFEFMRDWAEVDEGVRWKEFHAIADLHPETKSWAWHRDRVQDEADPMTIDDARKAYHAQPGVLALNGTDFRGYDDPYHRFGVDLATFQARARRDAVPGWSLLTLDGQWREKGRMGWFGMSDATDESDAAFKAWANEYLESLDDDVIIVAVDVHI